MFVVLMFIRYKSFTRTCLNADCLLRSSSNASFILLNGVFFTFAPSLFFAQNSSISFMSLMLPVFEVVQFVIVKPMVNVSIINLGTIPTKHIVPRGRKRLKNFSNSTVSDVAMVTKIKSNVPAAFSISSSEVCTRKPVAPCSRAISFFESEELMATTSFPNAFAG